MNTAYILLLRRTPLVRHALTLLAVLFVSMSHAAPPPSSTSEPEEIRAFPPSVQVAGEALQRNGAGIRYKAIFKVYAAALYLEKPTRSFEAISHLTGPKRVAVTMLRTINASELGQLFAHGMEDNMDRQQFSKLVPGVMRMSEVFSRHKSLRPGDSFTLDWIPDRGMVLSVNGVEEPVAFPEPEFYQAMLGIWLGPKPADGHLKTSLLQLTP